MRDQLTTREFAWWTGICLCVIVLALVLGGCHARIGNYDIIATEVKADTASIGHTVAAAATQAACAVIK